MELLAKFKNILHMEFRATLNFRKFNGSMAFNQFGAGSNVWKSDKRYTLREMTTRKVLKFNSTDIDCHPTLKPQSNGVPHMDQLCEIFDSMVNEMTTGMAQ